MLTRTTQTRVNGSYSWFVPDWEWILVSVLLGWSINCKSNQMGYNLQASPSASHGELRKWSSTYRWIPIVGGFFTFALAFMAGMNDVPVSFFTSVGSGVLTLSQSTAFAFLMEVLGATKKMENLQLIFCNLIFWKSGPLHMFWKTVLCCVNFL